ncbi:hypothetical protein RJT34_32076 [Clitoria ternatea]|uniref:ribose-5-phosphate isomerase n=1 Tax=Clitoria ternatea TaxID=43366 RepID=A0AAN9EVD0_CLITE
MFVPSLPSSSPSSTASSPPANSPTLSASPTLNDEEQACSFGIPLSVLDDHPRLDLTIDDADKVDPYLNVVTGRDGALVHEKMVKDTCDKDKRT